MMAIFGFCDIRQFTDTTEVLQEGIMEFVNLIAKIVHLEARHALSSSAAPAGPMRRHVAVPLWSLIIVPKDAA